MKKNILDFTPDALIDELKSIGFKSFVGNQLLDWVYKKHVPNFANMQNLSKENRAILADAFDISCLTLHQKLDSKDGLATKYIFDLKDGQKVESVVLKEKDYNTLCISSQCGCGVDCKFCLTGVSGFKRNLDTCEIVMQLLYMFCDGKPISHVVFMGMGEPLANPDAVFAAIEIITHEKAFHISKRKITVSTSGIIGGIKRLIRDKLYINFAFSVGHANPAKREHIMPIETTNPIMEVSALLHEYLSLHNRKLTLEYTLLEGFNDEESDIAALIQLAKYLQAKVNLINLNPHPKIPFRPVSTQVLHKVREQLRRAQVPVTIRFTKGQDIVAACGQLGESLN